MRLGTSGQFLAIIWLLAGSASAVAQNLNFLRDSPIGWLDDQDRAILTETIDAMLAAPDGTTTNWLNPATGSGGRIQVLDTHEALGTTCRRMLMRNEAKGRKSGGEFRLCLAKDGSWKFAPNEDAPTANSAAPDNAE
jgi:surface antigen